MQKVKTYKCPHCGAKYKSLQTWGNHVSSVHPELIPKGWSYSRYFYYILTGKKSGSCIVCKKETVWNEITQKYERFCKDPKCKENYRNTFKSRMINKYGKVHLLNDPDQQRKMLAGRRISGLYTFSNSNIQFGYVGTYEKDFLMMLDRFLKFDPNDLMMPSPHTYQYEYKNPNDIEHEGTHFFIPDAYIPSLNLEIEIKQNTNMHPKLLKIDKVKELDKDAMMKSLSNVNYIKIVEKDYTEFFKLIDKLGGEINSNEAATESSGIKFTSFDTIYTPKGTKRLSDFKIGKLDKQIINAYKKECPSFSHIRWNRNTFGEIVVDGDNVVGYYMAEKKDNRIWLQAFEITKEYQSYSLGSQLLTRAIRKAKITNLSVAIKNDVAIQMYIKNGFTEYSRNDTFMLMMRNEDNNRYEV